MKKHIESDFTHDRIQQDCYLFAVNNYPELRKIIWHTPNEFKRPKSMSVNEHRVELARRMAIGVNKGVTDLCLYYKNVLYIFDIKIGYDKLSDDQIKFIQAIESQGGKFYEINSKQQFVDILEIEILKIRPV